MKLIELYLDEIRRQLPPKNRDDIINEIHSNLFDTIEDRSGGSEQPADDETIKAVLAEFGPPRTVAQQYGAQNYLIGPRMFPIYLQVLKFVLIVVAALNLLGLVVAVVGQSGVGSGLFETALKIVGGLFSSLFTAFGIVTLSFAVIEQTAPEEFTIELDQSWSPDDLVKQAAQERVSIAGQAIEITLGLVFIALINFFLDRIGIYYLGDSGWVSTPILNNSFLRYVPWITATAVFDIGLNLYLIRKGFWDKTASIAKVLISAFKIAVLFAIITGPDVITISSTALQMLNFDIQTPAQQLSTTLNLVLRILLGLSIFGLVVESFKRVYDTLIKGSHTRIEIEVQ